MVPTWGHGVGEGALEVVAYEQGALKQQVDVVWARAFHRVWVARDPGCVLGARPVELRGRSAAYGCDAILDRLVKLRKPLVRRRPSWGLILIVFVI